MSLKIT